MKTLAASCHVLWQLQWPAREDVLRAVKLWLLEAPHRLGKTTNHFLGEAPARTSAPTALQRQAGA
eukprot:5107976-Amphidinium_carterae.1